MIARPLALAPALALALALAGCSVDVTAPEFDVKHVSVSSVASIAWDVRVAFERANATAHEQTVRVAPNAFATLEEHKLEAAEYAIVAATSAHDATRTMRLDSYVKGITIGVGDGGVVSISLIG